MNNAINNDRNSPKNKGQIAEDKACLFLQQQGLLIIDRNFYSRFGEIDIILLQHTNSFFKSSYLVFCEVRSRKNFGYGSALESIHIQKQKKLKKTADFFLLKNQQYASLNARFDVVIVPTLSQDNERINWLENAF